jgi:hypothetical protein
MEPEFEGQRKSRNIRVTNDLFNSAKIEVSPEYSFVNSESVDHTYKPTEYNPYISTSWLNGFGYRSLKGDFFVSIVKKLFVESGLNVLPNGYETKIPEPLRRILSTQNSATALQIRFSPDLIVIDHNEGRSDLVEIKSSSGSIIRIDDVEIYQTYYKSAVLVVVMNFGEIFYAQEIGDLKVKTYYDPETDFKPIQQFFPSIHETQLENYKIIASNIMKATNFRAKL